MVEMPGQTPRTLAAAIERHEKETGRAPCAFGIAMSRVPAKRWNTRADLYECLARARAHLDAHPKEPIRLSELAAWVGVSPFHFQRLFKEFFGVSPHDYLRRRRLEVARTLIERDGMSVVEACFEVGFQSPSSFTRLFKREFGAPPSAFKPGSDSK